MFSHLPKENQRNCRHSSIIYTLMIAGNVDMFHQSNMQPKKTIITFHILGPELLFECLKTEAFATIQKFSLFSPWKLRQAYENLKQALAYKNDQRVSWKQTYSLRMWYLVIFIYFWPFTSRYLQSVCGTHAFSLLIQCDLGKQLIRLYPWDKTK